MKNTRSNTRRRCGAGYSGRHERKRMRRRMTIVREIIVDLTHLLLATVTMAAIVIGLAAGFGIIRDSNRATHQPMDVTPVEGSIIPMVDVIDNALVELAEIPRAKQQEPTPVSNEELFQMLETGKGMIKTSTATLSRCDLPDKYYPGVDFSYFQPYMSWKAITNEASPAYQLVNSDQAYTDENGLRRYRIHPGDFSLGQDDYVVALGTFYKEKGTVGSRYLVVTSTGMYTCIAGDEKADKDTETYNMFTWHCDNQYAGLIEWLVDTSLLSNTVQAYGSVSHIDVEALQGEILQIYQIH